eukprot:3592646-Rhodomonas_salina.2
MELGQSDHPFEERSSALRVPKVHNHVSDPTAPQPHDQPTPSSSKHVADWSIKSSSQIEVS